MRIVFMGTPAFAVPVLSELVGQGHEIVAVYTRAPARSGRGMAETPSPVHALASRLGLPVHHPASLKGADAAEAFRAHEADLAARDDPRHRLVTEVQILEQARGQTARGARLADPLGAKRGLRRVLQNHRVTGTTAFTAVR